MALFFFTVGLEIKREFLVGELSSAKKAILPAMAAVGGMAVPAGFYYWINLGGDAVTGWGIPMATDITHPRFTAVGNTLNMDLKITPW